MDVEFTARGVGVGPGRKPNEAPPELLDILRQTHAEGTQANINIEGLSQAQAAKVARALVNGAKSIGLVARVFGVRSGRQLRFYAEDPAA